ncbi:energy transducer TonB [Bacteroidota bacterium]
MKTMKKNPDRKPAPLNQHTIKYKIQNLKSHFKTFPDLISEFMIIKNARYTSQRNFSRMFFVLGLCISLLIVITAFEWRFYEEGNLITLNNMDMDFEDILEIPITEQPPPPAPKIVQPRIIEVEDEKLIIEEIEVDLDVEITEETVIDDLVFNDEPVEEEVEIIFTIVEFQPTPNGGIAAFYEYISKNLKYPAQARRMGIGGKVFVQFVVDKDGTLTNVQCIKGIGAGCDEEAINVIKNAPSWNPGKQRGRPVKVQMIIPILFKLE